MPTKLTFAGKEPFSLPRPWNVVLDPGEVGYLRDSPAVVRQILANSTSATVQRDRIPAELVLETIALADVPSDGFTKWDPFDDFRQSSVVTESATQETLWEYALEDEASYDIRIRIVGKDKDAAGHVIFEKTVQCFREGGNVTLDAGSPITGTPDVDTIGITGLTISGVSSNLFVGIEGKAATNIQWNLEAHIVAAYASHN